MKKKQSSSNINKQEFLETKFVKKFVKTRGQSNTKRNKRKKAKNGNK